MCRIASSPWLGLPLGVACAGPAPDPDALEAVDLGGANPFGAPTRLERLDAQA